MIEKFSINLIKYIGRKMNYQEFILEIESKCAGKKKLQIDNFTKYCEKVGNPEKSLKGIHIGGTNGKGSTSAMIESILFTHGYSIGLNTSPHLVNYKERFRINKEELSENKILNSYLKYRDIHQQFDTSFFEISTALAFQIFHEEEVDYSVIEVGMGGQLDATKLINSEISVITNIGMDHIKSLGNTLEKIAWQKAGIIKKNVPIIIGKMPIKAKQVIIKEARIHRSEILSLEDFVKIENQKLLPQGNYFDIKIPDYGIYFQDIFCNMAGIHQVDNASTAILTCAEIAKKYGWKLDESSTKKGLANVIWQGRMQQVSDKPKIIIDGAHNPDGIEKLVFNLSNIYKYEKLICVIAILFDKDFKLMIKNLGDIVDTFIITKSKSERASTTEILFEEATKYTNVIVEPDVKSSIEKAKKLASDNDLICVTGSLYTIKEILEVI